MNKHTLQKTIAAGTLGLSVIVGAGSLILPSIASADTANQYYYDAQGNYDPDPVHASSRMAQGNTAVNTGSMMQHYYPYAGPSKYYLMTNESLQIMGHGFAPSEKVTVSHDGMTMDMYANGSGEVSGEIIPANMSHNAGMHYTFSVMGQQSGYSTNFTVEYGKYYPQIEPSSYYVMKGSSVHVMGKNFAPNEKVTIHSNGMESSMMADGSGTLNMDVTAPQSGSSFTIDAMGEYSQMTTSRTLTLMQSW